MTGPEYRVRLDCDENGPVAHVVQLDTYRERRRVRRFAAGLLIGYLFGAWVLPAAAELAEAWLDLDELADTNGSHVDRVAAYTDGADT